uniref:Uncharacterized protein n=1 Tax=Theileria annulata TaxID=5874 RepID=A0A3B0MXW1_THEAN
MTGNIRSRRAYHNTFGDEVQDTQNKEQFPTQGREVFSNPTQSHNTPFQNQSSFHNYPTHNTFTSTPKNVMSSDGKTPFTTDADKGNLNPRPFNSVPNIVSSPFSQNQPTNITSSPFRNTSIPVPSHPFNTNPANIFNPNPVQNFNPNQNFNPSVNPSVTQNISGNMNVPNQSQLLEDRSMMYLEGQLNQTTNISSPFSQTSSSSAFNQASNVQTAFSQTTNVNTNPLRPNFTNPTSLVANKLGGNRFSPLQSQLGAQLTKFGEMYTQRLQQSEEEDVVDPPLLDELGINLVEIYEHLVGVVLPKKGNSLFLNYNDLSGPLLIFVTFAMGLMFSGKICFSIIYVLSVFCNLGIYLLFNFLNERYISLSKTVTIMGYSLLPLCLTPVIWLFSRFLKLVSVILVYLCVVWSTVSATYLFQAVSYGTTNNVLGVGFRWKVLLCHVSDFTLLHHLCKRRYLLIYF